MLAKVSINDLKLSQIYCSISPHLEINRDLIRSSCVTNASITRTQAIPTSLILKDQLFRHTVQFEPNSSKKYLITSLLGDL